MGATPFCNADIPLWDGESECLLLLLLLFFFFCHQLGKESLGQFPEAFPAVLRPPPHFLPLFLPSPRQWAPAGLPYYERSLLLVVVVATIHPRVRFRLRGHACCQPGPGRMGPPRHLPATQSDSTQLNQKILTAHTCSFVPRAPALLRVYAAFRMWAEVRSNLPT